MSPAQLRNKITELMRLAGFSVQERENTPGARKVWLKSKTIFDGNKLLMYLQEKLPDQKISIVGGEFVGKDFRAERQGAYGFFVACYNKGEHGLYYRMGMDC